MIQVVPPSTHKINAIIGVYRYAEVLAKSFHLLVAAISKYTRITLKQTASLSVLLALSELIKF